MNNQVKRTLRLAVATTLLAFSALGLAACASNFGGDFFPDKQSNITVRGFVTVATTGAATTGGAGAGAGAGAGTGADTTLGGGTGSVTAANGGTEGPNGGNPTFFTLQFDPFPGGAPLLLGPTRRGTSVGSVIADNRSQPINIEVSFRGQDVNGNKISLVTFLPATGEPDATTLTGSTGGTTTGGAGTATSGQTIFTLRPTVAQELLSTGTTATTTDGGTTSSTSTAGTGGILESFPTQVGARVSITNGISVLIEEIGLRYFEVDGRLAQISAFTTKTSLFLEANPIRSGFSTTGGAG